MFFPSQNIFRLSSLASDPAVCDCQRYDRMFTIQLDALLPKLKGGEGGFSIDIIEHGVDVRERTMCY